MKILVTGGEGFIGRNIIKAARELGWETISVDIEKGQSGADSFHKISINDRKTFPRLLEDVDYVFHEAAVTSPPQFDKEPYSGMETNIMGTLNVLESSMNSGVKRVVMASSSSTYGDLSREVSEVDGNTEFINLYPMTKFVGELMGRFYSGRYDMEIVMLRYFNTYGVGENSKGFYSSVIHKFISDLKTGKPPVIYGDGKQSRDFIYVKDVANANILAAKAGKDGASYNIGTGVTTTFNDIYRIVSSEMNVDIKPVYEKNPFKSYQLYTKANIEKARREIGFNPLFDLKKGINEIIASYKN